MILDRRTYLSLCLGSFFLLLGAGGVMWSRWSALSKDKKPSLPEPFDPAAAGGTGWPAPPPAAAPAPAAPPEPPPAAKKRNILFSYRNSRPGRVEIVGSFNNWTPIPLAKGNNQTWETSIPLDPGEYTYNFLVDGKPVRDPNNPRTAPEGRSLLAVQSQQ